VVAGPDGTLYVSDYDWAGGISVYPPGETRTYRTVKVGRFPSSLAMTPDGTLYAVQSNDAGQSEIGVVAPGVGEAAAAIPVTSGGHWLTAGPDGSLYVGA
jgi:streptogramin lyase